MNVNRRNAEHEIVAIHCILLKEQTRFRKDMQIEPIQIDRTDGTGQTCAYVYRFPRQIEPFQLHETV